MPKPPGPHPFNLTPAELHAVAEHKYFMSLERGSEVSIEEAIEDFLRRFAEAWRREKVRTDNLAQRSEIEHLRNSRTNETDPGIDPPTTAEEWCERFAGVWRAERESLERNGFRRLELPARNPHVISMLPWSSVAMTAAQFDCDVYVHAADMPYWTFQIKGRPFMNAKSVVGKLSLGIAPGDAVEFIAMGAQADQALGALRELLGKLP